MAISGVGSAYQNHGSGVTTITAVNPTTVGDLLVVGIGYDSGTPSASGISHSGVTAWTKLFRESSGGEGAEVWLGTVTATGSATLTVSFSPSNSGVGSAILAQQFTAGLGSGTIWALDGTQAAGTTGTTTSTTSFASLTPAASGELYFGMIRTAGSGISGNSGTSGYTTALTSSTPTSAGIVYNPACSGSAQAPTIVSGGGSAFSSASALITAASGGSTRQPIVMIV